MQGIIDQLNKNRVFRVFLTVVLVFSLSFSTLLTYGSTADAATSSAVPNEMTFYSDNDAWSSSISDTTKALYRASDGTVAYCGDMTMIGPGESGTLFNNGWDWADSELAAVVYNGYPYTTSINGTTFSAADAQLITQYAIYMYLGQVDSSTGYYSYTNNRGYEHSGYMSDFMTDSMIAAVKYLSNGAKNGTLTAPSNVIVVYNGVYRTFSGTSSDGTFLTQPMIYCLDVGYLSIVKSSSNTSITSGNDCYSLAGAVFTVYDSNGNVVGTLTTDENGTTDSLVLPVGQYTVKETTAPTGYALNTSTWTVTINSGKTTTQQVSDTPQNDPADILLQKADSSGTGTAQGAATLEGAEYVVEYYDGYYDTAEEARASGDATRTWVFATDEDGYILLESSYLISSTSDGEIISDSLYTDSNSYTTLPLGTYVIYEYTAPEGYLLSDEVYVRQVTGEGTAESVDTWNAPTEETALAEQVIRGGVEVYKTDIESDLSTGLGAASMEGTQFEIVTLNENDVVVNGVTYSYGDVVATLTIKDGYASTSDDLLPYGTYSLQESYAGEGYVLDGTIYEFTIDEDGEIVTVGSDDGHIHDQVKRSDFELTKRTSNGSTALAGVAFKVTSVTTGESHVIVTDENGYFSSESSWNAHSSNTNGNDWALDVEGTIDSSELDATAGVWFGLTTEGWIVDADDSLGALPYDTYLIEELRCTANEGYQLISTTVTISRDGAVINLGTLDDPEAEIGTTATDALDGDNYIGVGEVTITDKVSYSHLVAGSTYTVTGQLYDAETGEALTDADGNEITSSVTFTADSSSGSVDVAFTFETWDLVGTTIVVFESLYDAGGSLIAEHKDLTDTDQQVTVLTPAIGTTAVDGADGDKIIATDDEATIVDTVSYVNLTPGEEYTVTGTVMVKSTGVALTDADGNPVTSTVTFVPETANGTVEVTFTFDSTSFDDGTQFVVFETLELDGHEIATHEDLDDLGQTVTIENPSIGTTAVDGVDYDKNVVSDPETVIIDTVTYENLVPGKEYTITGTLMIKSYDDEGNVVEEELLVNGEPVTASTTFTPESSSGTVTITFEFDSTGIESGTEIVAFESLTRNGNEIAVHADITDVNQTVVVTPPYIATTAVDGQDGDDNVVIDTETVIVDTVTYENLVPGKEYTITGTLYNKATGEPLLDADGNEITASTTFTPEKATGSVEVTFEFDSTNLKDATEVVVFETLYRNGVEVAVHADIDDESQTVTLTPPEIETNATDAEDGDKNIVSDPETVIVDTVTYENLVPGKEYTITGTLMIKSYDDEGNVVEEELRVGTGETTYEVYDEVSDTWIAYESIDSSSSPYYTFSVDEDGTLTVWKVEWSEDSEGSITNPSPSGSGFLSVSDEEEVDDDGFPVVDWDYWLSVNPDIIGWVTVPGTNISQPIVQASSDDPTYYLKHDVYGNYNIYGCPYLDADCAEDGLDSLNAVIFGHHISDGSMFATFASYSSQSFAEEHQIILLQTPDSKRILQVNFSRVINASKIMKQVSFEDDAAYQAWYLSELEEAAVVVNHSSVPTANTTFVTCSYNRFSNERTLVYASVSVIYSVE